MECPNEKLIIDYATRRGLKAAQLEHHGAYGWKLLGKGLEAHGWPLVWTICEELGITRGSGASDYHQIDPEKARLPEKMGGIR